MIDSTKSVLSDNVMILKYNKTLIIYVTSFTEENCDYWSQKQTRNGNIHPIILDVHVGWQSAQIFPLIFLQHKLDKNFMLSPFLPLKLVRNLFRTGTD